MKLEDVKIGMRVDSKLDDYLKNLVVVCLDETSGLNVRVYNILTEDLYWVNSDKITKSKQVSKIYTFDEILKEDGIYTPSNGIITDCKIVINTKLTNLFVSGDGKIVTELYESSWITTNFVKENLTYKMKFKEIK